MWWLKAYCEKVGILGEIDRFRSYDVESRQSQMYRGRDVEKVGADMKKDKIFLWAHFSLRNFHTKWLCLDGKNCNKRL